MGKVIVVLLATLFICGAVVHYFPATMGLAFGNSHGVSWLLCIGVCTFIGSWKMMGK